MSNNIFIPLSYDKLFNSIFGNDNNIDILEVFLEDALELDRGALSNKVVLKNRSIPSVHKSNAYKQSDLIVDVSGDLINIEMNNELSEGILKRNIVYLANTHGSQYKEKDKSYKNIYNSIQINLNSNRRNIKYVIEPYYLTNYKNISNIMDIIEYFSIINIDLKMGKMYNRSRIDKWCTLILAKDRKEFIESVEKLEMEKEKKEKLRREVEDFNSKDQEIAIYSRYSREELERNTLIEEGIEENTKELVKNMLKEGIDTKTIAKVTNLSIEEINKIKRINV